MRLLRADTLTRAQWFLIAAAIVIALGLFGGLVYIAGVSLAHIELCPVCHIGIVRPSEMVAAKGDVEPSKNLLIWNGSSHGSDYENYAKICTHCWMAFDDKRGVWERASEVPDAFRHSLSAAIQQVPLPPREHIHYRIVYTQYFRDRHFGESVSFSCDDIPEVIQPLRDYATAHNLFFRLDEIPPEKGQHIVHIETNPPNI